LFTHALAFTGPTWFAMTSDGGQHWSAPKIIVPTGQNNQTLGNQIVIAPDGTLYDFFDLILTTDPNSTGAMSIKQHGTNVAFVKSADGGATWSAPQIIAELQSVGVTDPNTGAPVTSGDDANVEPAVDPSTGALYVVWQDARFSGGQYDEVAIAVSTDGGAHWTAPARVNTPSGRPAFTPAVKVATDGTVGVSYYDFRTLADGNTTTLPTTYWLKKAPRGGAAFGADIAIVPANQPFNLLAAPFVRGGYFLGDYQGLVSVGTTFVTAFVQSNCADNSCAGGPNPTDVFTASFS
jgi:hypothetical protein